MAGFDVTVVFSGLMLFLPHLSDGKGNIVVVPVRMEAVTHSGETRARKGEAEHDMRHEFELRMHCDDIVEWRDGDTQICCTRESCEKICSSSFDQVEGTEGDVFHAFPLSARYDIRFLGLVDDLDTKGASFEPCHSVEVSENANKKESCLPDLDALAKHVGAENFQNLKHDEGESKNSWRGHSNGRVLIQQGKISPLDPKLSLVAVQRDLMWRIKAGFPSSTAYKGRVPNLLALTGKSSADQKFLIELVGWGSGRKITMGFNPIVNERRIGLELVVANEPHLETFCRRTRRELSQFTHFTGLFDLLGLGGAKSELPWPRLVNSSERELVYELCQPRQAGNGPVYCYGGYSNGGVVNHSKFFEGLAHGN